MGLVTAALPGGPARAHPGARQTTGDIVSCAIHPAIGVARVGNSPTEFFLGPEVPGPHPEPVDGFKDAVGRLKRQAARFRVYGLDAAGNVIKEITSADAELTWTVHLANAKAAWYEFDKAFDLPEARGEPVEPMAARTTPLSTPRRNASVTGAERSKLVVDPGPRSIAGVNANAGGADGRFAFDGGRFFDQAVPLGELRTDVGGRLLVLGGTGRSGSNTCCRQRVPGWLWLHQTTRRASSPSSPSTMSFSRWGPGSILAAGRLGPRSRVRSTLCSSDTSTTNG
ncbi:MAG: valyl-tRNA synthetase [Chloroflexi bacterium]|nr:valyl-tRNA synthetase [Chloroflexota bacterium]